MVQNRYGLRYNNVFSTVIFYSVYILLIMPFTCLKISTRSNETHFGGRLSQQVDIVLSFCFIVCRRCHFTKKKTRKKSYMFEICHKVKSRS